LFDPANIKGPDMTARRIAIIGTGFSPTGGIEPPLQIAAIAASDFKPELIEPRMGPFPRTPYDRALTALGNIDAGIRASRAGAAGIFINTFGDYGLGELRSALSIPVIGAGQSAMALAATLGRRFAIVSIWPPSLRFIFEDRLADCGMQALCSEIISILDDDLSDMPDVLAKVDQMRAGGADILDRIVGAAQDAIARGADTIVLGCTCMAPIAARIAARLPVPVIDPMTAGYKACEAMISLNLSQSTIAYPRASATSLGTLDKLLDGAMPAQAPDDCPICVTAAD